MGFRSLLSTRSMSESSKGLLTLFTAMLEVMLFLRGHPRRRGSSVIIAFVIYMYVITLLTLVRAMEPSTSLVSDICVPKGIPKPTIIESSKPPVYVFMAPIRQEQGNIVSVLMFPKGCRLNVTMFSVATSGQCRLVADMHRRPLPNMVHSQQNIFQSPWRHLDTPETDHYTFTSPELFYPVAWKVQITIIRQYGNVPCSVFGTYQGGSLRRTVALYAQDVTPCPEKNRFASYFPLPQSGNGNYKCFCDLYNCTGAASQLASPTTPAETPGDNDRYTSAPLESAPGSAIPTSKERDDTVATTEMQQKQSASELCNKQVWPVIVTALTTATVVIIAAVVIVRRREIHSRIRNTTTQRLASRPASDRNAATNGSNADHGMTVLHDDETTQQQLNDSADAADVYSYATTSSRTATLCAQTGIATRHVTRHGQTQNESGDQDLGTGNTYTQPPQYADVQYALSGARYVDSRLVTDEGNPYLAPAD